MLGNETGLSGHMSGGLTGFHMNALFALIIVLAIMLGALFLVDRLKKFMPRFLNKRLPSKGALSICDVVQLDSKRKLVSVSVESHGGNKALAILLIGGGSDICVGWMDEVGSSPQATDQTSYVVDSQKAEKNVPNA